jgi:hypothetical protein
MIPTIIISAIILAVVAAIIIKRIVDRKKGKSSCGCGCSDCAASSMCHSDKKE